MLERLKLIVVLSWLLVWFDNGLVRASDSRLRGHEFNTQPFCFHLVSDYTQSVHIFICCCQ